MGSFNITYDQLIGNKRLKMMSAKMEMISADHFLQQAVQEAEERIMLNQQVRLEYHLTNKEAA